MNIFLSCTKEKENKRCKAREMYMPSSLFSKSYEYAKSLNPDKIYILSAKHHLLPLSREIEPYNVTLNDASVEERKEWTEEVLKQMKAAHIDFNAKTYFFCCENYIEFLKEYFPNSESIYAGKGIGEIMHWLDDKLKKVKESLSGYLKYINNDMKNLNEYLNEAYNDWFSKDGCFNNDHIESIVKLTKWQDKKVKQLINDWEGEFGGVGVEYEYENGKLVFNDPDSGRAWECDGKKWKEIKK